MNRLLFFALKDDLFGLVREVEANTRLSYTQAGNFDSPELTQFYSALDIPNLGVADSATASTCTSYLVTDASTAVEAEATSGSKVRYVVDQRKNPDSVGFTPAGLWEGAVLLHGRVATASNSDQSHLLMKLFTGAVRKQFTKVKAFHVGPSALAYLQAGHRLTISAQSPRDFDLTLP
jgi:hypothetical protein